MATVCKALCEHGSSIVCGRPDVHRAGLRRKRKIAAAATSRQRGPNGLTAQKQGLHDLQMPYGPFYAYPHLKFR